MDNLQNLNRLIATCLFLALFNAPAWALTNQDAIGTFSGTQSITTFCVSPSESGTFTGLDWSVTGSNLSGDNFDFDGTSVSFLTGVIFTFSGSATITGVGTSSGSGTSFLADGTATGTFTVNNSLSSDGNTLTSTSSGSFFTPGGGCLFTNNVTATRIGVGADIIVTPALEPSSTIMDVILFNIQIQFTVSNISSHIAGALSGRGIFGGPRFDDDRFEIEGDTGLNAGDGSSISYGVWGNYSYSDFDNDLSSIAFDGSTHSFLGGIDFSFWENTVMGVAFGYDNSDIDTTFNQGHQDTDTYTIAPYFGALISDNFSLDFNIGYSNVDYDQFRTIPGTTTRVTSSPDSDRWFGAFNLNGVTYYDNWILGARIGALWAENELDSFTESNGTVVAKSNTKVSTGSVAGDVAYSYQNFEPFLNLAYQYDFSLTEIAVTTGPQPSNDDDDILMTMGVRYYDKNGISGNLEYSKRFDRDDFDEDRISLTLRVDF